jgi:hypothetical protein
MDTAPPPPTTIKDTYKNKLVEIIEECLTLHVAIFSEVIEKPRELRLGIVDSFFEVIALSTCLNTK